MSDSLPTTALLYDIRRAFRAPKPCARTCPIAYAHHASKLDGWRSQRGEPLALPPAPPSVPVISPAARRSRALAVVA